MIGHEELEVVRSIALETRADFMRGSISDDEILEAATATGQLHQFTVAAWQLKYRPDAEDLIQKGSFYYASPLTKPEIFPRNCCNEASVVLTQRIKASAVGNVLLPKVIEGGCGENRDCSDPTSYYDNYHAFVGIGKTILGSSTIVDITADQFVEISDPVYVGKLEGYWTTSPRLEADQW